jgi:uncharacterized small protein (DUF1192 family)
MSIFDEEPTKPAAVHQIGQDLSLLSVSELAERVDMLKAEIGRLETELATKDTTRNVAEALFRKQ